MARKFGQKNNVDLNILRYNHCLLGTPKVGKTTLVYQIMEKLVGEEGYIFLEMGRERGADAIQGIVYEDVPTWNYLEDIVDDIIENKETDYKNLKMVVIDTYDQFIELAEARAIYLWNRDNPDKKVKSINSAWGGFGRGEKKAMELMFGLLDKLQLAGIGHFVLGHIKNKEQVDIKTGESYTILTSDQQANYFNALKKTLHILSIAYIDREIVIRDNDTDKKEKVVKNEVRKISFRDDGYAIDTGSRFEQIVGEIPMTADDYIKAVEDAIEAERNKSGEDIKVSQERQKAKEEKAEIQSKEKVEELKDAKSNEAENEKLIEEIKGKFRAADSELQKDVLNKVKSAGFDKFDVEMPTKLLKEVNQML